MVAPVAFVLVISFQVWAGCALNTGQDDICLDSYSWSVRRNDRSYVYQYTVTETTKNSLACEPGGSVQHAEKVHNVQTLFYGSVDDNDDVITCLNITFEVNRHSASNLKGLIFTLVDGWSVRGYEEYYRWNFTTGLNRQSVYDQTTETKNRLFHFDCFCDLKISDNGPYEYQLNIHSLPFQSENCTMIDDQTVRMLVKIPVCGDAVRSWTDKYCQMAPTEPTWNPAVVLYQAFPEYNKIKLTFEPAPHYYPITHYQIFIYSLGSTSHFFVNGQVINVDNLIMNPLEIHGSVINATSMEYEVNADPGDSITVAITTWNGKDEVKITKGPVIIFQGNPCDSNPCGSLGFCIPLGPSFYCQCREGALNVNNQTCIENPCESNSCGPLGLCIPLGQEFYCQCAEGALNINNQTCIENVCGDSSLCGPLGSCIPLGEDYYCQCNEEALNRGNHTCIRKSPPLAPDDNENSNWQQITVAAVVGAVVAFAILAVILYWKLCRSKHSQFMNPNNIEEVELPHLPCMPTVPSSDDILFAYPEENHEFVHLVELLAALVGFHGGIRPVLPSQHTIEMGQQGQEVWLERTVARVKKILWVCSAETNQSSLSYPSYSYFEKLLALTKDEREERKDKHVVCFFSAVSSRRDVPPRLCEFQRFELLKDLEWMCLYLNDMERHTLEYRNSMPYISGQEQSAERSALEWALERWQGHGYGELESESLIYQEPSNLESLMSPNSLKDSGLQADLPCEFVQAEDSHAMANAWQFLTGQDECDSDDDNKDSGL